MNELLLKPWFIFWVGIGVLGLLFTYFAVERDRSKRNVGTLLTLIVAIISGFALYIVGPKPGIDLAGGSAFTVQIQPSVDESTGEVTPVDERAIAEAVKVIEGRLNELGGRDLFIQPQGKDRIIIEMPGVSDQDSEKIEEILQKVAVLQIRAVHPQNSYLADQVANGTASRPPGYILTEYKDTDQDGETFTENILLSKRIGLDGSKIKRAFPDSSRPGTLQITLTSEGGDDMRKLTEPMRKGADRLASVLDGEVISAPTVQDTLGSNFQITGMGSYAEAELLSNQLLNPLKNPLKVEEKRKVSPRLGEATIKQGIMAGIVALGLTFLFVIIYYRFAGIIALIGLSISILILFGSMAMFGFTFTLPGIAGIVLTIGMAVDANVLIFERLREELAEGKSLGGALRLAYEKAFSAIFDANITTLITAIILFWRASGAVKGFAVTLTVGILASMFAALLVTRVFFWWGTDVAKVKKLSFMKIVSNTRFNFLGLRKTSFVISLLLIVGSLSAISWKREKALGIDFAGGSLIRYQVEAKAVSTQEVIEKLSSQAWSKSPTVQEEGNVNGASLTIRCASPDVEKVQEFLASNFEKLSQEDPTVETVGASLGKDFLKTSLIALGIGLALILLYISIRFEFSFAVGAFVALIHDVFICLGLVILLRGELSLIHVGAILTIAGYSINDTIIVFDRIRETLQTKTGEVRDIMNTAINATLSRTIITSVTTFITVLILFLFGGSAMKDFAFTIIIGILVGTYSSIFVASPTVAWWARIRNINLRKELLDAHLAGEIGSTVEGQEEEEPLPNA